jgi:hypothetical protein
MEHAAAGRVGLEAHDDVERRAAMRRWSIGAIHGHGEDDAEVTVSDMQLKTIIVKWVIAIVNYC